MPGLNSQATCEKAAVAIVAKAAAAINDSLRSATQARVAIAKLTGEHAAERHELAVTTLSDADLDARIRELEGEPG